MSRSSERAQRTLRRLVPLTSNNEVPTEPLLIGFAAPLSFFLQEEVISITEWSWNTVRHQACSLSAKAKCRKNRPLVFLHFPVFRDFVFFPVFRDFAFFPVFRDFVVFPVFRDFVVFPVFRDFVFFLVLRDFAQNPEFDNISDRRTETGVYFMTLAAYE